MNRSSWSRFDTPGSTVYLAGDRRTAYAETLAMARVGKDFRDAVAFAARQFGLPVEVAQKMIQDDWTRNGNMVPGWLPANWRDGRLMYTLRIDKPIRWVDLTAAESIAALNRHLGQQLDDAFGIGTVTLSTLAGEDREATTAIAQWLREQVLDDGNYAAGVRTLKIRWRTLLGLLAATAGRPARPRPSSGACRSGDPPQRFRSQLCALAVRTGVPIKTAGKGKRTPTLADALAAASLRGAVVQTVSAQLLP